MRRTIEAAGGKLYRATFARYFASSAAALCVDSTIFFVLIAIGAPAGPASALAYAVGILAHWLITSRAVFVAEVAERGPARTRQKFFFVLSALAGLAVTTGIVSVGASMGANLVLTKGIAVAVSFTVNWLLRRFLVFPSHAFAA
jgi:putative flippase GtrA